MRSDGKAEVFLLAEWQRVLKVKIVWWKEVQGYDIYQLFKI